MEESKFSYAPHKIKTILPLRDVIMVSDMTFDERISNGGIVLLNDDMKSSGIRPRWAKVYAIGPEQQDVKVGQYILISHGRWTRGIKIQDETGEHVIRKVDNNDVLLVSDTLVNDQTLSDKVY
jgi:co-chaperonin GroES (HSP10)